MRLSALFTRLFLVIATLFSFVVEFGNAAFSLPDDGASAKSDSGFAFSRRDLLWKAPLGATFTYAYGRLAYTVLSLQGIEKPQAHEQRIASTIERAFSAGALPGSDTYRVLEVGIGTDCRVLRRGLYDPGLDQLAQAGVRKLQLVGIDLKLPDVNVINEAKQSLSKFSSGQLDVQKGDITQRLNYPDGYFDSILLFLTLCSVSHQEAALSEVKRLLRPNGGTLGYVEHVAVNPDETSRSLLELEQRLLDPLQQALVDNCHLHRYTQEAILSAFEITDEDKHARAQLLSSERFFVDSMWPVCCQCCGVVRRTDFV